MRRYTHVSRTRWAAGLAAVVAMVAVAFGPATPASAFNPVGSQLHGWGSGGIAEQNPLTHVAYCSVEYSGPVTVNNGPGKGGEASIDQFSTLCDSGVSITARSLPWTFTVESNGTITVPDPVIDVATAQGTCRFAGDLTGFNDRELNTTDLSGGFDRVSGGCGLRERISFHWWGASNITL